jgi:hypothetical protein
MQSSHRLRPAMALVRALLALTASGDGAGERFCAPLPPSPPRFRGIALRTLMNFGKPVFLTFFFVFFKPQLTWKSSR